MTTHITYSVKNGAEHFNGEVNNSRKLGIKGIVNAAFRHAEKRGFLGGSEFSITATGGLKTLLAEPFIR